jgi:hypothetical protein
LAGQAVRQRLKRALHLADRVVQIAADTDIGPDGDCMKPLERSTFKRGRWRRHRSDWAERGLRRRRDLLFLPLLLAGWVIAARPASSSARNRVHQSANWAAGSSVSARSSKKS